MLKKTHKADYAKPNEPVVEMNQCGGMAAHSRVHCENYTVRNGVSELPTVLLPTSVYLCSIVWTLF